MTVGPVSEAVSSSVGDIGGESSSRAAGSLGLLALSKGKDENRAEGGSGGRRGSADRVRSVGVVP